MCPVLKELTDDRREMYSDFSSLPCRDMSITMEDQKGELAGQQWRTKREVSLADMS